MMPDYKGRHLSPYGPQFNMNVTNPQPQETARFSGYAAGPWLMGYPINYAAGNSYTGMTIGSNTNMSGMSGMGVGGAGTSAGESAAEAGGGDAGGAGDGGGGDGGGGGQ
jgi:hypothetical protein